MQKRTDYRIDYMEVLAKCAAIGDVVPRRVMKNAERQYMKVKGLMHPHKDRYGMWVITTEGYRQLARIEKLGNFIAKNVE